jgi:hypothetical protein
MSISNQWAAKSSHLWDSLIHRINTLWMRHLIAMGMVNIPYINVFARS